MKTNLSKQRQQFWRLWRQMGRVLRRLDATQPMTPGSLYWMGRKCGKSNCGCARGQLHYTWVVTRSEEGRARLYTVTSEQRQRVRQWTGAYRLYQRSRAQLVKLWGQLLGRVDGMAENRRVAWPEKEKRRRP